LVFTLRALLRWIMSNRLQNIVLLILFTSLSTIGILHHEIWLDEAHHWLFARDSQSIKELWLNMRYDGHPILWNTILFVITRFSSDVLFMQIVNICISIASLGVFLFFSPFNFTQKIFFTSGYFILYEYTVISRNYALMMLALFLVIICYNKRRYLLLGFMLALLANTHLFGFALAVFFGMMVLLEFAIDGRGKESRSLLFGSIIFLFGIVITLLQVIPPPDSNLYTNAESSPALDRLARTSTIFFKAFVPIPDITDYHFWNSNLLMAISKPACAALSILLLFSPFLFLKNRLPLLLFFYFSVSFVAAFVYFSNLNAVRYYGAIYLILISCAWINWQTSVNSTPVLNKIKVDEKYFRYFINTILVFQMIAGVVAYSLDLTRPFSESKNASDFMQRDRRAVEYASAGCGAATISAYLERRVYYLNIKKYGSFCEFSRDINSAVENEERLKKDVKLFATKKKCPVYLITHIPLRLSAADSLRIKLSGEFTHSVLRRENYFIYLISKETR